MDPITTSCTPAAPEDLGYEATEIWRRLSERHPFPLSAAIELTHRCDLSCPHCYVAASPAAPELTTAELLDVLDQMVGMGVIVLTLTGGEPTVRGDFGEILRGALDRRFVVGLKTNAANLGPGDARRMADWGLYELCASLYHTVPEEHDRFVGRDGAWRNTVAALREFKDAGRCARASIMVTSANADAVAELEELCDREGWRYTVDIRIEPRTDGGQAPARLRAAPPVLAETVCRSAFLRRRLEVGSAASISADAAMCGADEGLVLQPDGIVIPCVSLPGIVLGDVRRHRLTDVWRESAAIREKLSVRWRDVPRCTGCDLLPDCRRCPATGFIEHGDFTTPSALDCELAAVWREARRRLQRDG
jgi:radical SAM protein with 4Fe4S-binding SPASM domain